MTIVRIASVCALSAACWLSGVSVSNAHGEGFEHICSWEVYNPVYHGVGDLTKGYTGAAFDGRYVYFAPHNNGLGYHGEVLRFDTTGDYREVSSWSAFDAATNGVGSNPRGFWGAVFDGQYVYFVPNRNDDGYHGEVLRHDTTGDFNNTNSWAAFDPGSHGVGTDPDGYVGGAFDGRYIYFSPYHNGASQHGEVLRLDTTADFSSVAAWETFDAGAHGVGDKYGYCGVVFDGRFVYFVANCTSDTTHHGEFRRYDTTAPFNQTSSWSAYDPGDNGVGNDPDGYVGGVFDGRFVYFAPYYNDPTQHGEVLRLDTTADFSTAASWSAFDAGASGIGSDADGYIGCVFDGRYVYFVPCHNGSRFFCEALRFDTTSDFNTLSSWTTFDPSAHGLTNGRGGYCEGVFDGRHVYFAPNRWGAPHGQVLRFDTGTCPGDLNRDTEIDLADLAQLLGSYGMTTGASCLDGDIDRNGNVDLADLAELLANYGEVCN